MAAASDAEGESTSMALIDIQQHTVAGAQGHQSPEKYAVGIYLHGGAFVDDGKSFEAEFSHSLQSDGFTLLSGQEKPVLHVQSAVAQPGKRRVVSDNDYSLSVPVPQRQEKVVEIFLGPAVKVA